MVQFFQPGPGPGERLGQSLGMGFGQHLQQQSQQEKQQQQASLLSRVLSGEASPEEIAQLDPQTQLEVSKINLQQQQQQSQQQQKQLASAQEEEEKLKESGILAKFQSGENLSREEMTQLSPTSLRTLIGQEKKVFEPTEERLEAERVSSLATEIENEFKVSKAEDLRLDRMEKLSETDQLTTPMMKKVLDSFGLPLGVLNNPDSEEFVKLEADFLRDVRSLFPGRVTNFEVQSFLKGVPTLSNTKEGRKAIVRNRKLMNEAKKVQYDAYRDILKENNGRKPRNLGLLLEDRVKSRLDVIADEFREGITKSIEPHMPSYNVKSPNGTVHKVPGNRIKEVIDAGGQIL